MVCPDSTGGGPDACIAMHAEKFRHYADVLPELAGEGIAYRPLIWSCWGRPHCDVGPALGSMAAAASRRRGGATPAVLARRVKGLIGIQLWRRAASMVASCIPSLPAGDAADLIPAARDRRLGELGLASGCDCSGGLGGDASLAASSAGLAPAASAGLRGPERFRALRLVFGDGPR